MDRLHPKRALIESDPVERERERFNLDQTLFFYDLMSTYFEGQALANLHPTEDRRAGGSGGSGQRAVRGRGGRDGPPEPAGEMPDPHPAAAADRHLVLAGVKANVIFFDKKEGRAEPWTDRLWVYDLRTNMHFTLKQKPIRREDFDEFVECYKPGRMHAREAIWSEANPEGTWRAYDYEDLLKRASRASICSGSRTTASPTPTRCRRPT